MMFLGERADGGIMSRTYEMVDALKWVNASLDDIRQRMDTAVQPQLAESVGWLERLAGMLDRLAEPLTWGSAAARAIEATVNVISDQLWELRAAAADIRQNMMHAGAHWTVTFAGDPIASMVGQQIMAQLRAQGVRIG
jgi:hypothetical protein